jgi:hypothetical protein
MTLITPEGTLSHIRIRCDHAVDEGLSALQDDLPTEGEGDNQEARSLLTRAVNAANTLRHNLEQLYVFGIDDADMKEQPYLD